MGSGIDEMIAIEWFEWCSASSLGIGMMYSEIEVADCGQRSPIEQASYFWQSLRHELPSKHADPHESKTGLHPTHWWKIWCCRDLVLAFKIECWIYLLPRIMTNWDDFLRHPCAFHQFCISDIMVGLVDGWTQHQSNSATLSEFDQSWEFGEGAFSRRGASRPDRAVVTVCFGTEKTDISPHPCKTIWDHRNLETEPKTETK